MDKKKKLSSEGRRNIFQFIWALITNSFAFGFAQGKIYTGKLKTLCLPGLNCYSCPGAVASCPIGSLQAVISSRNFKFSFYVVGFMVFIGAIFGRFVCGWLCPFGLLQDLLNKIPFPKKIKTFKGDKLLRNLKYVILLVFVIILPMCLVDITGLGDPWFCKFICPAGTIEGGIPLTVMNESLRKALGFLWAWKFVILVLILVLSVIIYRPFCKYLCPLGGVYSLFNGISVFRLRFDENKCISCNKCSKVCKMNVDPTKNPDHTECIRCGLCVEACPTNALTSGFVNQQKKAEKVNKSEKK